MLISKGEGGSFLKKLVHLNSVDQHIGLGLELSNDGGGEIARLGHGLGCGVVL